MNDLAIFRYEGADVRTIVIDGEPWFVAADVARVLGYRMASDFTRRLDDDEKGTHSARTPGGMQDVSIISESGLYIAVIGSQTETARDFKRWITREVIPAIRKTGMYSAAAPKSQLEIIRDQHESIGILLAEVTALAPRAEAWDEIAAAEGDYSVGDAAKMLARAGVETGPQRLFEQLAAIGWIFRARDGKWRAYADKVSAGYVAERPQSHHHPRTGEVVVDAPQVRVTLRGVERLRVRLGTLTPALTG